VRASRILLWRHGRTAWNAERRFQGHSDLPLDSLGERQAQAAAPLLVAEAPDLVLSSDLERAVATAAYLGVPFELDPRLREVSLGRWEGKTREEVEQAYPQEMADWLAGRIIRRGGGELQTEVAERALFAVAEADADTVVLVTHGGTAKSLTGRLLGLAEAQWRIIAPLANCHWSDIRREPAGWRLHRHNVGPIGVPVTAPGDSAVDAEDPAVLAARR
jgi:probable phosphoglycerate mutase